MNSLFKPFKNPLLIVLLAIGIMMTLTACQEGRLAGCEGDIIIENEIPDLVMRLGDEPFRRDVIYDEPVVFRHTAGKNMTFTAISTPTAIVSSNFLLNQANNSVSIVQITPRKIGETLIVVEANDECFDRRRITTFKVTVLEDEEENNN
jgi:hypothetical protein